MFLFLFSFLYLPAAVTFFRNKLPFKMFKNIDYDPKAKNNQKFSPFAKLPIDYTLCSSSSFSHFCRLENLNKRICCLNKGSLISRDLEESPTNNSRKNSNFCLKCEKMDRSSTIDESIDNLRREKNEEIEEMKTFFLKKFSDLSYEIETLKKENQNLNALIEVLLKKHQYEEDSLDDRIKKVLDENEDNKTDVKEKQKTLEQQNKSSQTSEKEITDDDESLNDIKLYENKNKEGDIDETEFEIL